MSPKSCDPVAAEDLSGGRPFCRTILTADSEYSIGRDGLKRRLAPIAFVPVIDGDASGAITRRRCGRAER